VSLGRCRPRWYDADEKLYVAGWDDPLGSLDASLVVHALDAAGTFLWERRFIPEGDHRAAATDIAIDPFGRIAVLGRSTSASTYVGSCS
jgi:hypothetical protein